MASEQQALFNKLVDQEPEAWLTYLRSVEYGSERPGLSMLVVFHHAAGLAKRLQNLEWAEVAVRAAELEARSCEGAAREDAFLMAMRTRSWFLCQMGARADDFVLDKQAVLGWVTDGLGVSIQTAAERADLVRTRLLVSDSTPDVEERHQLMQFAKESRRMKHRLNLAKQVADCGLLDGDSPLHPWLEMREQLI